MTLRQLIELDDGLAVLVHSGCVLRRDALDDDCCQLFLAGNSPVDGGFRIERPYDEVLQDLNDGLREQWEDSQPSSQSASPAPPPATPPAAD